MRPPSFVLLYEVEYKQFRRALLAKGTAINADENQPGTEHSADTLSNYADSVNALAQVMSRATATILEEYKITGTEFTLLKSFLDRDEWTATQLTDVLPVKAPRISRLVNGLVERGLLMRSVPRHDRRVVVLTLTDEGREIAADIHERVDEYQSRLMRDVGENEKKRFLSTAAKIARNYASLGSE